MYIPEMSLVPPEPAAVGLCPACRELLLPGDPVWRGGGRILCEEHMDSFAAALLGWRLSMAEAEDGKDL